MIELDQPHGIAIFHDNFAQMGGAERVTEALHKALPEADLLSTLSVPQILTPYLQQQKPKTTWMQWLPAKAKLFRHYFMLYPFAIETVDLRQYRLIISSCFGYAKGIRRRHKDSVHVCYCHNPMRWVWRTSDYLAREKMGALKRRALLFLMGPLRSWEMLAASRPDYFIANSTVVAKRLKEAFGVTAEVIFPPVETSRFQVSDQPKTHYIVLARLAPYKRVEIAVEACTQLNRRLIVIGDGADRKRLESLAGPTVTFVGRQPDDVVARYISECKALLYPGEEDFGITPLEVNAAGRPVVAFGAGGVMDTIIDGLNGVLFERQNVRSMMSAIERLEQMHWDPQTIREYAQRFDTAVFHRAILDYLQRVVPGFSESHDSANTDTPDGAQNRAA